MPQKLAHLPAVLGLGGVTLFDGAGVQEIAVDLAVQVLPVGDHHKGVVAGQFSEDFAGVKDHGETLARPLGMPEHPQLALLFRPVQEHVIGLVDANKLVVLGDDFLVLLIAEDEVFDVVQQSMGSTQAGHGDFQTGSPALDPFAVDPLFFIGCPQPVEKKIPNRR